MKTRVFRNSDYLHEDGMLTKVWGPSLWHTLHVMSFNYPLHPTPIEKRNYKTFILNLQNVLPCKHCRNNLKKNFKQLPLTAERLKNREAFSRYIYELHELVNKMLKKKSNLTYCDVRERYEHFRARCSTTQKNKNDHSIGCTEPVEGKKSKCILKIVPDTSKQQTFQINKNCLKKRKTLRIVKI